MILFMKRKFKHGWLIKQATTSHFISLDKKQITTGEIGSPGLT